MAHGTDVGPSEPYELEPIGPERVHLRPAPSSGVYASAAPVRTGPPAPVSVLRSRRVPEPPLSDVAFRRWLFAPVGDSLRRLVEWAGGAPVCRMGPSRLVLEPPLVIGPGHRQWRVLLHRWLRPPIPMELALEESCAPFGTQLTLRPVAEVRAGRRYFRAGNRLLNEIEDRLEDPGYGTNQM